MSGINGPRVGATTGRQRNSLTNLRSKQNSTAMPGGFVPPVGPGTALGLGSQAGASAYGLFAQLAALRTQKAAVVAGFKTNRAGIKAALPDAVAHAANTAAERGATGSSIDLAGRAEAHSAAATAMAAARQAKTLGLLGVKQGQLDANAGHYMNLADINAQRRSEQLALAIAAFENDEYDAVQHDFGAMWKEFLAEQQDSRTGRTPRRRRGLEHVSTGGVTGGLVQ